MRDNKGLRKAFVEMSIFEGIMAIVMIIGIFIIKYMNGLIYTIYGSPTEISYSWGMIFGGWVFWLPKLMIILGLSGGYIASLVSRGFFLKFYLKVPDDIEKYVYLLIIAWLLYLIVPYVLLMKFFSSDALITGAVLVAADIFIHYFCYSKSIKIEEQINIDD